MINKDVFEEVLEDAKKSDDYQKWLNKQLQNHGVEGCIFQPTCSDSVIKLLHNIFEQEDSDEMISYFCFELDYGRKWKEGSMCRKDGSDINLSTSSKLYDYLMMQKIEN